MSALARSGSCTRRRCSRSRRERQMLLLASTCRRPVRRSIVTPLSLTRAELEARRMGATVHALGESSAAAAGRCRRTPTSQRATWPTTWRCAAGASDIARRLAVLRYGLAALTRPLTRVPVLIAGRRSLSGSSPRSGSSSGRGRVARGSADLMVANSRAVPRCRAREAIVRCGSAWIRNGVVLPRRSTSAAPGGSPAAGVARAGWGRGQLQGRQGTRSAGRGHGRRPAPGAGGRGRVRGGRPSGSVERAAGRGRARSVRSLPRARSRRPDLYAASPFAHSPADAEGLRTSCGGGSRGLSGGRHGRRWHARDHQRRRETGCLARSATRPASRAGGGSSPPRTRTPARDCGSRPRRPGLRAGAVGGERRRLREMQERVGLTTTTGMEGAS